jgi:hypothetical protein
VSFTRPKIGLPSALPTRIHRKRLPRLARRLFTRGSMIRLRSALIRLRPNAWLWRINPTKQFHRVVGSCATTAPACWNGMRWTLLPTACHAQHVLSLIRLYTFRTLNPSPDYGALGNLSGNGLATVHAPNSHFAANSLRLASTSAICATIISCVISGVGFKVLSHARSRCRKSSSVGASICRGSRLFLNQLSHSPHKLSFGPVRICTCTRMILRSFPLRVQRIWISWTLLPAAGHRHTLSIGEFIPDRPDYHAYSKRNYNSPKREYGYNQWCAHFCSLSCFGGL